MKMISLNSGLRMSFILPALWALAMMSGCAGPKVLTKPCSPEKMIHYSELENMDETRSLNNYVVYVNAGDTIALAISMDTDFMAFKQEKIDIVAKQKLYFMIEMPDNLTDGELAELKAMNARGFFEMNPDQKKAFLQKFKLFISRDAVRWAPLHGGGQACREVLGYKSGMISFGVTASTNEGLGATLIIKTVK